MTTYYEPDRWVPLSTPGAAPSHYDHLRGLLDRVEARSATLDVLRRAWAGESATAYLTRESAEALDGRLSRLSIGWPRLIIRARCDRLRVTGFRHPDAQDADPALWSLWRAAGLPASSELVHVDRDLYGAAFVTVWGHGNDPRRPVVTPSSPRSTAVDVDPATGDVQRAARWWTSGDVSHAVLHEPDVIRRYRSESPTATATWRLVETIPNPFGVVPVVPFVRRLSSDDVEGTSAVADVLDLTDAAAKALQDAIVTSEFYARPRRWATGLELKFDDDGNAIDPYGEGRYLQAESPDAKFGQLDPPRLDSYTSLLETITAHVGAVSGLPPHALGINGDQPANAESIRAAETQLTTTAYAEQRALDPSWSAVASWLHAIATGGHPDDVDPVTLWASPEVRTPAQAADAAAKLSGIGVPLAALLDDPLGFDPQRARQIVRDEQQERITRAALDLSGLLPRRSGPEVTS